MKRLWWTPLLLAAAAAQAADWRLDCPAQLATAQSIAGSVPAGWAPLARTPTIVQDVKGSEPHAGSAPAVGISIYDGPPNEMADLVPDDPNARVVRWTFAKTRTRGIYVVCHYADT
ncbi:MAG: hypothetical protein IT518_21805, partial [Burkholderiales bacterium]|nr:hypothetical protein [Burkholderiales bacterium]